MKDNCGKMMGSVVGVDLWLIFLGYRSRMNQSSESFMKLEDPLYIAAEVIVAIFAVIGNFIVVYAFFNDKKLRRLTNYYVVSLAFADFLIGLLGIPFAIMSSIGLPRNFKACLCTNSFLVILCTISIFNLFAVSVDRYWAIIHPMKYSIYMHGNTAIG